MDYMNTLLNYGFTQQDINCIAYIYNMGGKVTNNTLMQMGCDYNQCQKLMYANRLLQGRESLDSIPKIAKHYRIVFGCTPDEAQKLAYQHSLNNGGVDTKEQLVTHLKKINKGNDKIGMDLLKSSTVNNVPRFAVVSNISQEPFTIWNSQNYKGAQALYKVVEANSQKITVETAIKPRLEYGHTKKIPGVLEIRGLKQNGNAIVTFDKDYCKLCNRFIIIASLRNPEFHLGKYELVCFEGTKVYVYATNMGTRENVRYNMGNQRIYAFGIFPSNIKGTLDKVAKSVYDQLHGVNAEYSEPNSEYRVVPIEKKITEDDGLDMGE